jgi:hypothetical protein
MNYSRAALDRGPLNRTLLGLRRLDKVHLRRLGLRPDTRRKPPWMLITVVVLVVAILVSWVLLGS